jgi:hypothetical protein
VKQLTAFLFFAGSLYAQTPAYPGAIATDNNLKVQVNGVQTSLLSPITSNATTAPVYSCTGIVNNSLATIDQEITAVLSCSGNIITFSGSSPGCSAGRGCDGTSGAAHNAGAPVSMFADAWHHNALRVEVEAIENTLGVNLANVVTNLPNPLVISSLTYAGVFTSGAAGYSRFFGMETDGRSGACSGGTPCQRWIMQAGIETESGGNAGSNFEILRYSDSGTYIDSPFSIARATGAVSITDVANIAVNSASAALTINNTGAGIGLHIQGGGLSVDNGTLIGSISSMSAPSGQIASQLTLTSTNTGAGGSTAGAALTLSANTSNTVVYATNSGAGAVIFGQGSVGISGQTTGTGYPNAGVVGTGTAAIGVLGQDTGSGYGGYFTSSSGYGLQATSSGTTPAHFTGSGGSCSIIPTTTSLSCTSDARKKQDDLTITDGLDKVMALRPLTFRWKADLASGRHDGFFAQELQQVLPSLVTVDGDGFLLANYTGVIPYLVSAIQTMQREIEALGGSRMTGVIQ